MNCNTLKKSIASGEYDNTFRLLYPNSNDAAARYTAAVSEFCELFGEGEASLFSAPGRSEVGGNHTDHQHGCVLAAGVDLDIIAVARKTDDGVIRIKSKGYPMDVIELDMLTPQSREIEKAASLIRGVAARFKQLGYTVGGIDAYTTSNVLKGSGLSSSAAFEVMVGTLINELYNNGRMDAVQKAIVAQYAENEFFKKPCGLMDQTACSCGGFVAIDFNDTANPVIEKVDFDFTAAGHSLCIVDTGGCHADLTDDYAGIPSEMKRVAEFFGEPYLRRVDEQRFYESIAELRAAPNISDRCILRAVHFFDDNLRAQQLRDALKANDFDRFLEIIKLSGASSLAKLQNVYSSANPDEQGLTLALAITERLLDDRGAYRVHGGGFAGTIQAFVPHDLLDNYKEKIQSIFGEGSCYVLNIRPVGGVAVTPELHK